jgi:DNA-binding MurR/RpiR family transcriptional regulator
MTKSKHGGTRVNFAVSQNGTGSVVGLNGASQGHRDYATRTGTLHSELSVTSGKVADRLSSVASEHARMPSNRLNGNHDNARQDVGAIVKAIFDAESRALAQIPKALETEALELAADALINARRIYCYAVGGSRLLASEAEYQFVRLGLHCVFIQDWMQLAIQTALYSSDDVVLAFSHSGRERRTVQGLALARRTGATTIGVTSEPGSPLVKHSEIALILPGIDVRPHQAAPRSNIPELTLIHAIAAYIAWRTSKQVNGINRCDELIEKMLIE